MGMSNHCSVNSRLVSDSNPEYSVVQPRPTRRSPFSSEKIQKVSTLLLIPIGILMIRSSRQTWIEFAFFDLAGSSKWYGKFTMLSGLTIAILGVTSFLPSTSPRLKDWLSWTGMVSSLVSVLILIAIAVRVEQINTKIGNKASTPERLLDDTFLAELGKILANISGNVSDLIAPKLSFGWENTMLFSVLAFFSCLVARLSGSKLIVKSRQ